MLEKKEEGKIYNSELHDAAFHLDKEKIIELINEGYDINIQNSQGETPLMSMLLFIEDDISLFKYLIDIGADIEIENNSKETVLMDAVNWERYKVANYLIKKGANVHKNNKYGDNLFSLVLKKFDKDKLKARMKFIKNLISLDVSVNNTDDTGSTPLMWASVYNPSAIPLIEKKITDINQTDKNGNTALMYSTFKPARRTYDLEARKSVKELIKLTFEINKQNSRGFTALMLSAEKGFSGTVNLLIENGANKDIVTTYGYNARELALLNNHKSLAKIL